jgi:hypothetical protein
MCVLLYAKKYGFGRTTSVVPCLILKLFLVMDKLRAKGRGKTEILVPH